MDATERATLDSVIPAGWERQITSQGIVVIAPSLALAERWTRGAKQQISSYAQGMDGLLQFVVESPRGEQRHTVASFGNAPAPAPADQPEPDEPGSYAPERINPDASYEEVEDFIRGNQMAGRIVTVMSMNDRNPAKNDLFLRVNNLQIQHRAGGWKMGDWVGTDAKSTVWVRSFDGTLPRAGSRPKGHNYYQELINLFRSGETYIPDFEYLIDRPNGAGLWQDVTSYHFVRDYGGNAARIAVSRTNQSTQVEAYASN